MNSLFIKTIKGGHSLIGRTTILHVVISGSSPDVSKNNFFN